ncbi:hypothetical protein K1T71_007948 [Dendrolimus kikuchii]|uniref:Uncharacterized protein n=1 Tax=Dendrolimus kikuchii TaxID=765133 RepID=A0ACC1CZ70_9NEOP|nr:hypothetical protein K1T71_007948 [Dendrolimus kikuchii]
MKFLVVLAVAVACAVAKEEWQFAPIVKSNYDQSPDGAFQYAYETGNGIYAQASGAIKNPNSEYPALGVQGAYKYTAPDGSPVEVTYTADENGYQPQGSVIPVPQPIPEAIARSLAYIASHPPAVEKSYSKPNSPVYG